MREIKFRAWDNKHEMFIPVEVCYLNMADGWVVNNDIDDGYEDLVVMQFTGLKDKNGKEIYEGDILESKNKLMRFEVYWSEDWTMFTIKSDRIEALMPWASNGEVIGNIYENPQLLPQAVGTTEDA